MTKIALIDSDGLLYHSERESLMDSLSALDEKIQNIFDKTECTHYVMFISNGKYFRHSIDPQYKASREKYRYKVKWTKVLKQYLIAQYNAQWMEGVEADDLISYWYNKPIYYCKFTNPHSDSHWMFSHCDTTADETMNIEKIICSPDKDLLHSIPGNHFNYTYKLENKDDPGSLVKGWWVKTCITDVLKFKNMQLIIGDNADGVKTPFPENCGIYHQNIDISQILYGYIWGMYYETPKGHIKTVEGLGVSKGIYEFQKNYRLLHMLNCDEDFMREIGRIPSFPEITEVKKQEVINSNIEF